MTKNNNAFSLAGKKGLILGLANENSIAWGCTQLAHQMGAELVVSCLNDKARRFVEPLTAPLSRDGIMRVRCCWTSRAKSMISSRSRWPP